MSITYISHVNARYDTMRYGLKSLFSAIFLCTLCLAWLGARYRSCQLQQASVDVVRDLGGTLWYGDENDIYEETTLTFGGGDEMPEYVVPMTEYRYEISDSQQSLGLWKVMLNRKVIAVGLERKTVSRELLEALNSFDNLQWVEFRECKIQLDVLQEIGLGDSVRWLILAGSSLKDRDVRTVSMMNSLEWLDISNCDIGDESLRHLRHLRRLRVLDLTNNPVTDKGLEYIGRLTNLEILWLIDTHISDAGMVHIAAMRNLRFILLHHTNVTDQGLRLLGQCSRLTCLTNRGIDPRDFSPVR